MTGFKLLCCLFWVAPESETEYGFEQLLSSFKTETELQLGLILEVYVLNDWRLSGGDC